MVDASDVLIVIPARGGSKRLPRKNVLPLAGKPLVCWSIETAINTKLGAQILVSSDDDEILAIASNYENKGVVLRKRPDALASDTASTTDVLIDAIDAVRKSEHNPKVLILLQPTSPLRTTDDVLSAYELFKQRGSPDSVVTVCEVDHPTAWVGSVDQNSVFRGAGLSAKRSQDFEKEYRLNGAVYVLDIEVLMKCRTLFTDRLLASVMPRKRSIDIDEKLDFLVCECLIEA